MRKVIVFLFHFLFLTTPFVFTWINEELFEFNKTIFTYLVATLIMASWLARMVQKKRWLWRKTLLDWPILFFLLSQILATIFSIHPYTSFWGYYTRFHGGLLSTITYIALFYAFVSNIKKKELPFLIQTNILAALLVSLYAIPEHFGHSPSCILIGLSNPNSAAAGIWQNFNIDCWVQDVQNRVFASFGQPNWLAAYLVTLLPVSVALFLINYQQKTKETPKKTIASWLPSWQGLFFLLSSSAMLVTLLFTKSRSGFWAFLAGMLALTLGLLYRKVIKKLARFKIKQLSLRSLIDIELAANLRPALAIVFFSFLAIFFIFGSPYSPKATELWQSEMKNTKKNPTTTVETTNQPATTGTSLDTGGTESGEIRKIVWHGAFKIWQRYPFFGSGTETFAYSYYQDRPLEHNLVSEWDFLYNKAHNEFLNFLATTGLVGLSAYSILLIGFGYLALWIATASMKTPINHHPKQNQNWQLLSLAIGAGLIAMSVSNFFGFSTVMVSILLFLLPACLVVIQQENEQLVLDLDPRLQKSLLPPAVSKHWQQLGISLKAKIIELPEIGIILLGCIALAMALPLFKVSQIWGADYDYHTGKSLIKAGYYAEGLVLLQDAIAKSPREALFYDELANTYADLAIDLASIGESTASAELVDSAVQTSDYVLYLNPRQLNFYKTRARIFVNLSQIDPQYLPAAATTFEQALVLAPTDAKLMFHLAIVKFQLNDDEGGLQALQAAIAMKDNFLEARFELGKRLELSERLGEAQQEYQYILEELSPGNLQVQERLDFVEASLSAESNFE